MQFSRTKKVPKFADYQQYRPYLRRDFLSHCAYCTGHETEFGGEDHFEIDHFRPTTKFPKQINKYKNLYYACRGCNKNGSKGEHWPKPALRRAGYRFFDPVKENAYILHMREMPSGMLRKRTNVGEYSIEKIRLNRDGLVLLRKKRRQMRQVLHRELRKLLAASEQLQKRAQQPAPAMVARLQQLRNLLNTGPVIALLPDWW
jgi:hypothetical protein